MKLNELGSSESIRKCIANFVGDPNFETIVKAFVTNPPSIKEHGVDLAHGKLLGTIFVFNELESIVKAQPKKEKIIKQEYGEKDPDLKDE